MVFNLRGSDNMTNEEIEKIIAFKKEVKKEDL